MQFVEIKNIEKRNAHSIIQQLRHRLRTVNCRGNRQHRRNCCGKTGLRVSNLPTNRKSL